MAEAVFEGAVAVAEVVVVDEGASVDVAVGLVLSFGGETDL